MKRILGLWINGRWREEAVAENALLLDYLRDGLAVSYTHLTLPTSDLV